MGSHRAAQRLNSSSRMGADTKEGRRSLRRQGPHTHTKVCPVAVSVRAGKEFPTQGRMRAESSLLEWETLLEQQAGTRRAHPLHGLVANLHSLKTEKTPVGRVALGDWLGCYRVGTAPNMESGSWQG